MPIVKTVSLNFKTSDGKSLPPVTFQVSDGKSSYETWLGLPGNTGKTEQDYIDYLRFSIPVVQEKGSRNEAVMSQKAVTQELNKLVPKTLTINNKPLNDNITLSPTDINTFSKEEINQALTTKVNNDDSRLSNSREWAASTFTTAEVTAGTSNERRAITAVLLRQGVAAYAYSKVEVNDGFVPQTRTVNGKPLNNNIQITLEELGGVSGGGTVSGASKLTTPRMINGTNFDGTTNITTANWGSTRAFTIGNETKQVNGGGVINYTLAQIGAASASHTHSDYFVSNGPAGVVSDDAVPWNANSGVYRSTNPGTSELIAQFGQIGGNCPALQLKAIFKNGGLFYRSARDTSGFEEGFIELYTTKRKPTLTELNAEIASAYVFRRGASTFTLTRSSRLTNVVLVDTTGSTVRTTISAGSFQVGDEINFFLLGPNDRTLELINPHGTIMAPDGVTSAAANVASIITGISYIKVMKIEENNNLQVVMVDGS